MYMCMCVCVCVFVCSLSHLREQELLNAMTSKDHSKSLQLAFELNQPRRLLSVFEDIIKGNATMTLTHTHNDTHTYTHDTHTYTQ